jgi:hypothetical protein
VGIDWVIVGGESGLEWTEMPGRAVGGAWVCRMEDDGLYLPEIRAHSLEKLRRHNFYAATFSKAMARKWRHRVYIGLYAGAGRAVVRGTGEVVETSAPAVVRQEVPFTKYIFVDSDPRCTAALADRVASLDDDQRADRDNGSESVPSRQGRTIADSLDYARIERPPGADMAAKNSKKPDVVQVKNPKTGHYVNIDRAKGRIISHKKAAQYLRRYRTGFRVVRRRGRGRAAVGNSTIAWVAPLDCRICDTSQVYNGRLTGGGL